MDFVSPRPSMFPEAKPRGTLRWRGNKTHCFPRGQSLSVLLYFPTQIQEKKLRKNDLLVAYELYEGCALQYERQSNRALLPKRHNDSLFLCSWQKWRLLKLLCLLLMLNSRILGLIWRGTAYFLVNDTNIFLTGEWRQWSKCGLPNAGDPFFWRQIKSLKTQIV